MKRLKQGATEFDSEIKFNFQPKKRLIYIYHVKGAGLC